MWKGVVYSSKTAGLKADCSVMRPRTDDSINSLRIDSPSAMILPKLHCLTSAWWECIQYDYCTVCLLVCEPTSNALSILTENEKSCHFTKAVKLHTHLGIHIDTEIPKYSILLYSRAHWPALFPSPLTILCLSNRPEHASTKRAGLSFKLEIPVRQIQNESAAHNSLSHHNSTHPPTQTDKPPNSFQISILQNDCHAFEQDYLQLFSLSRWTQTTSSSVERKKWS